MIFLLLLPLILMFPLLLMVFPVVPVMITVLLIARSLA